MKARRAPFAHSLLMACLVLEAAPARALDLTGTWSVAPVQGNDESMRCTYFTPEGPAGLAIYRLGPLEISQNGASILLESANRALRYQGVASPSETDRGKALATSCEFTSDIGSFPGTFRIRKADAKRGTLKGTFVGQFLTGAPVILSCKFKATRTSTTDPAVAPCP